MELAELSVAAQQVLIGRCIPERTLVICGGKLIDEWSNVADHCLLQFAAAEVLCEWLELPEVDTESLCSVAACHDWDKRLTRNPDDFSHEEKARAQWLFAEAVNPDIMLLRATGPSFLLNAQHGIFSFTEAVQFYLDDICSGSKIVRLKERIDEVSSRRLELNEDPHLSQQLIAPYWEVEKKVASQIEGMIFDRLVHLDTAPVQKSDDIPLALGQAIQERCATY